MTSCPNSAGSLASSSGCTWKSLSRITPAHFHAYYQDDVAVYSIDPVELIAGALPRRRHRLVEAWAELHQPELVVNWERLQAGQTTVRVDPLK